MWELLFLALSQALISVSGVFVQLIFFGNWPPNIAALQTITHATIQMMEENLPVLIRSARGDAFDLDNVTDVQDVVVQLLCTHMLLEVFVNCNCHGRKSCRFTTWRTE